MITAPSRSRRRDSALRLDYIPALVKVITNNGKVKELNYCHVNARSILANTCLFELEILCASNKIDVLCASETWLTQSKTAVLLPEFQPPFRNDRSSRGGGDAIFVRAGSPASPVRMCHGLESVCFQLHLPLGK